MEEQDRIFGFPIETTKVDDIQNILRMHDADLNNLPADHCDILAWEILQHAMYVHRNIIKLKTALHKKRTYLKRIVANNINNYKGCSWEYAEQRAINDSPEALSLQSEIIEVEETIKGGYKVVSLLEAMSETIKNLKFQKRNE